MFTHTLLSGREKARGGGGGGGGGQVDGVEGEFGVFSACMCTSAKLAHSCCSHWAGLSVKVPCMFVHVCGVWFGVSLCV